MNSVDETLDVAPAVLVVDDNSVNRELIAACIGDLECEVRTASTGRAALAMIETEPPDVVLLDVQMPDINGYDVCRRIRSIPSLRLMPVIMITALDQIEDRVKAMEWGADDFMTKPVERVELVAVGRQAFDGLDLVAVGHHRKRGTGLHRLAVEMHDTGAALRGVAPHMGAGEPQILAQKLHQECTGIDIRGDGIAVNDQGNLGHQHSLELRAAYRRRSD